MTLGLVKILKSSMQCVYRSNLRFLAFVVDYRRIPRALSHVYFDPITSEHDLEINKIFKSLASEDPSDPPIRNRRLSIWGRTLLVPESTSKIAKFNFEELCGQPLSAADYLEVTKNFGTVFLLNVPKMDLNQKDLVRCLFFLNNLEFFNNGRNCRQEDSSPSSTVRVISFKLFSHIKNFLLD